MKKYLGVFYFCLLTGMLSGCQTRGYMGGFLNSIPAATRVQQALYLNEDPVIANVRADSVEGVVVLTGYVKKIRQSDEAEAIARGVPGVHEVKNDIIIRQ